MWWTLNMSFGFSSSPSSTNIMESMRLSTADNWVSREIVWMQTILQREGNCNAVPTRQFLEPWKYALKRRYLWGWPSCYFQKKEMKTVWGLPWKAAGCTSDTVEDERDVFVLFSLECFAEYWGLNRSARSHLIVLFNARESRSHLRVAASVVGVTHNGHHFKLTQCSDESRQGNPSMLLRGNRRKKRSPSTGNHQQCTRSQYSHLIIFGSEELYDLISHKVVALHLEADGLGLLHKWIICLHKLEFSLLKDHLHYINTVPGSVWWSQGQQSTSHHACISSALDPLWRMGLYRYHSETLRRNFKLNKHTNINYERYSVSYLGLFHSLVPLSHCHHPDSTQFLFLHHLSGWFEHRLLPRFSSISLAWPWTQVKIRKKLHWQKVCDYCWAQSLKFLMLMFL